MPDTSTRSRRVGWIRVAFGDVVQLSKERSSDPSADGFERYIGLEHIDSGELRLRRWGKVADGVTFTNLFRPGQVLFGKRRAYQRKVAVADFSGVCSGDIYVLESKGGALLPELLPFICQADAFVEHAVGTSAGSLSPRTNWKSLASFEFALPPIEEQRRIARCLTVARSTSERLEALAQESKSLLRSAIDHQMRSCPVKTIGELVEKGLLAPPQDGNHGEKHPKAADYVDEGVPFVMAADLQDGVVNFTTCTKLREDHARRLRIGFARNGDILLSHKGTLGSVARLEGTPAPFAMLTPQVTYYRSLEPQTLLPDWLYFSFQSTSFQGLLLQHGRQSTRAYIGITAQRELSIPICEPEAQLEHITKLTAIENAAKQATTRCRALRDLQGVLLSAWLSA